MKWTKSKLCWLFLALLLWFASGFSWGEVSLTDEEYQGYLELEQILTILDDQLTAQGRDLRMLTSRLSIAQTSLIGSQIATDEARRLSKEVSKSYQEREVVVIVVAILGSMMVGVLAFAAGLLAGG